MRRGEKWWNHSNVLAKEDSSSAGTNQLEHHTHRADIIESTARIVIAISFHRPSANRRSKSLAVVGLRMYFQSDQNGPQRTRKTCRG